MPPSATPAPNTNTFSVDYRVLAVAVSLIVVLAGGWLSAVMRQGRADERIALLEAWKAEHTKQSGDLMSEIRAKQAQQDKQRADDFAQLAAQNAELSGKLTDIRLIIAAKIH